MRLYIIIGAAVVVLIGAVGAYIYVGQADKETDRITQGEAKKLSEGEVKALATKSTGDFQTAMQASEQAGAMKADEQVTLWKTQLASENPAVQLKAAQELMKLDGDAAPQVRSVLQDLSVDAKADKDVVRLVQKHLGAASLARLKGDALVESAVKQLTDPRVGVRWAAVDVLAAEKCGPCKEALAKVAKADADEDLRMVAEMAIEEMGTAGGAQ